MDTLHVCFADTSQQGKSITTAFTACSVTMDDTLTRPPHPEPHNGSSPSSSSVSPTPRYERNMSFFQQLSRRFGLRSNADDPVYSAEDDSTDSCSSTTGTMPPMQCSSSNSMSSSSAGNNNNSQHCNMGSNTESGQKRGAHKCSMEHISCASSETSSTLDIDEQTQAMLATLQSAAAAEEEEDEEQVQPQAIEKAKERRSSARASFSRLHRRSTSSIRRAFESFSLSSRSLSCSGSTPPPPPNNAAGSSSSNSGTPIKSALKNTTHVELHKRANSVTLITTTTTAAKAAANSGSAKTSKSKTKPPPQRILRQPVSYTYLKGMSGLPTQRVPRSAVCCQYARR